MNTPDQEYLKLADSRSLDVLLLLWDFKDAEGNLYVTLDEVAGQVNVTKVTVNRVFQKLYKAGYLTKVKNGHYKFNEEKL